jgi:predicted nucleic acid-binding protein
LNLFVLDACALIAVLAMEQGADKIRNLFQKTVDHQALLLMNKFNFLEVYYRIYRVYGEASASDLIDTMKQMPILIKDTLDDVVLKEAGRLKVNYKLSIADSIAIAETIVNNGTLVTSDHHEIEPVEKHEKTSVFWFR